MLKQFKEEILKHDFVIDSNFVMTDRRRSLKDEILKRSYNNYEASIKESLFNFWEFINDDVDMCSIFVSRELNLSIKKGDKMIQKYWNKGIICLQEKDVIIEMIDSIESHINR